MFVISISFFLKKVKSIVIVDFKILSNLINIDVIWLNVCYNDNKENFTMNKNINFNIDEYVVYTIEASGIFEDAQLIKIEAVKVKDGEVIETFSNFVNPNIDVDKDVLKICKISKKNLKNAPQAVEVLSKFKEFINNNLLVGFNQSNFDMMIINKTTSIGNYQVDLLNLAQKNIHLPNYKLKNICKYFNIAIKDDCVSLFEIFEKLKNLLTKEDIVTL